jgi:hypothetical protein
MSVRVSPMSAEAARKGPLPPVTRKEQQYVHVPGVEMKTPVEGMVRDGRAALNEKPLAFTAGAGPFSFDVPPGGG